MIVTEAEAKTKRCQESFPVATELSPDGAMGGSGGTVVAVAANPQPMYGAGGAFMSYSTPRSYAPSHCIGSACMAWKWLKVLGGPDADGLVVDDPTRGYCGKAGR